MAVGVKQQQRRGLEAEWAVSDVVLDDGEFGVAIDTGVIKIGDGANTWTNLPAAFADYYLPKLGKAADSELLDGISADAFLSSNDVDADPDPNKIPIRDASGRMKAVDGAADSDVATYGQLLAARRETVIRTVTGNHTLLIGDACQMIFVDHTSQTAQIVVTIPTNASVAFPIGTWVDICTISSGGAKLTPASTVTLSGVSNVMPNFSLVRLLKTATNTWIGFNVGRPRTQPRIRAYKNTGGSTYAAGNDVAVPFNTTESAYAYNPDNEWFTIPSPDLATARRILVNKDGLYTIQYNGSYNIRDQSWVKLFTLPSNNTLGTELAAAPCFWNGQAFYRGRLTAGTGIGAAFYNGAASGNALDEADGLAGHRHDLTIIREGD